MTPSTIIVYKTIYVSCCMAVDGSLGLTLEERAQLASASRHALRTYSRERCHLPGRLLALLYDGIRHMHFCGSWSSTGMTWQEVQLKYQKAAKIALGSNASQEDISFFVYRTIVQKSCSTNEFFDRMAYKAPIRSMKPESLLNIIQSCRSIISWTSSSGGSSSDSMREYESRSRLGGHMLQMESSNILSTVTAGEDRTHELRHLVKPSIAPSLYDTDVTMKMIITSGGENENNNGGSPQPTDNRLTDYSSSSTILRPTSAAMSRTSEIEGQLHVTSRTSHVKRHTSHVTHPPPPPRRIPLPRQHVAEQATAAAATGTQHAGRTLQFDGVHG